MHVYLLLWFVKMFHNVVHSFTDSFLNLICGWFWNKRRTSKTCSSVPNIKDTKCHNLPDLHYNLLLPRPVIELMLILRICEGER